jgi:hypothetical protein
VFNYTDPGSVDEDTISFAPIHNFGVTGYNLDSGLYGRGCHRLNYALKQLHRQAFFKNESGAQIERTGAAHGQIIYRPVDSKCAYVSSGEEQRVYHIGIGGKSCSKGRRIENRAVMSCAQYWIAEGGQK